MSIQRLSNAGQSGFRYKSLIAGITPVASVPVIGEATALTFSTASVTFTAPGVYAATTFTATSSPGGLTGTSATSPITVSGLSEQTAYTFTVTATNATGTSGPSAASNSVTTPVAFQPDGAFDALSTVTVPAGGVASITFAGIPNTYKHLQIRWLSQNSSAAYYVANRFNDDTTSSYAYHRLVGNGSAISATGTASEAQIYNTPQSAAASIFSVGVMDIFDYANTSKFKTTRTLGGWDQNGSGRVELVSGLWQKTDAINRIDFFAFADNFTQHSQFTLYGVK